MATEELDFQCPVCGRRPMDAKIGHALNRYYFTCPNCKTKVQIKQDIWHSMVEN